MKLIALPNGAFIDLSTVTSIRPVDHDPACAGVRASPPRVLVDHAQYCQVLDCDTFEQAKELAATLAQQVNDALEPRATVAPATGSTPELVRLVKQALPGFDYLLMTSSVSEEIVKQWKRWADDVTAALDATVTGSTPASSGEDEWLPWPGGDCPVAEGTLVDVRYRDGEEKFNVPAGTPVEGREANADYWENWNYRSDIIAYRIAQ